MTFQDFNLLPYEHQLATVYATGTFLATRWQAQHEAVNLYELPGHLFVEVTYDMMLNTVLAVLSFERSGDDRLPDYAMFVKLPDWMPDAQ